jgi:hypothetical protein
MFSTGIRVFYELVLKYFSYVFDFHDVADLIWIMNIWISYVHYIKNFF